MSGSGAVGPRPGQRTEAHSPPPAETIVAHDCTIVLRRISGPQASELFFLCQPPTAAEDAGRQAEAAYRAILGVLEAEGGGFGSVVCETLFLRSLQSDLEPVRAARGRVLSTCGGLSHRPATTEIEQPPLNDRACLEIAVQAIIPGETPLRVDTFEASPACACVGCANSHGLRIGITDEARFYAGGLCGAGDNVYEQTLAMFGVADDLLRRAGMAFRDVVRTWIHLRDIDRDYDALNRARRVFFDERGVDPVPASTGIGGAPGPDNHHICLSLYAVQSADPHARSVMVSPTLNEAPQYGADFARGMRIAENNRIALCVSGTASIDEAGRTAHPGDFEAQADRMLVNVAALLQGQGATFGDVVSAVTYLKHPAEAGRLRQKFHEAGYEGFPNVMVAAPVCRADLLCETEVLAVLPPAATPPSNGDQTT